MLIMIMSFYLCGSVVSDLSYLSLYSSPSLQGLQVFRYSTVTKCFILQGTGYCFTEAQELLFQYKVIVIMVYSYIIVYSYIAHIQTSILHFIIWNTECIYSFSYHIQIQFTRQLFWGKCKFNSHFVTSTQEGCRDFQNSQKPWVGFEPVFPKSMVTRALDHQATKPPPSIPF